MASDYYDPQKAHEYYERTKQLKGRRTTRGFSEEQKALWAYAKNEIKTEQKTLNTKASEGGKSRKAYITRVTKERRQAFTEQCKEKCARIRDMLDGLSPARKKVMRKIVSDMCAKVREEFAAKKAYETQTAKEARSEVSQEVKLEKADIKAKTDAKLDSAYASIKSGG